MPKDQEILAVMEQEEINKEKNQTRPILFLPLASAYTKLLIKVIFFCFFFDLSLSIFFFTETVISLLFWSYNINISLVKLCVKNYFACLSKICLLFETCKS